MDLMPDYIITVFGSLDVVPGIVRTGSLAALGAREEGMGAGAATSSTAGTSGPQQVPMKGFGCIRRHCRNLPETGYGAAASSSGWYTWALEMQVSEASALSS